MFSALIMFFLLTYWIITGITAEDVSEVHYQLENSSVCLHVKAQPPYVNAQWLLAKKVLVVSDHINPTFANRMEYFSGNSSLCIKNLTDADSGVYGFSFTTSSFVSIIEEHKIVLQGLVPTPVIVMPKLVTNSSAGTCNISVNCSVRSDWLWSVCDAGVCSTAQSSLSEFHIEITAVDKTTLACSGNNNVSTKTVSKDLSDICHSQANEPESIEPAQETVLLVIGVVVCLCLFVCIIFVARKLSSRKHNQNQQAEAQTHPEPRVSTSSSIAYENVAAIQPRQTSSMREDTHSPTVDTVYSVLQPPKVDPPQGTSDKSKLGKGPQKTDEARASPAEQPGQISTVYSTVKRPSRPALQQ